MRRHPLRVCLLGLVAMLAMVPVSRASVTFTNSPAGHWAYSRLPAPAIGEDAQYYPTTPSEYAGSQFQGFVADSPWSAFFERSEFHVFTTYATSATTQQIPLLLDGDDGHSLFVNDTFVGGGGFDADVSYTLNLPAGVPVKLEVAGYNGPGDWVFVFGQPSGTPLSQTPGVSLDATNAVPEPTTSVLAGTVCLFALRRGRRNQSAD